MLRLTLEQTEQLEQLTVRRHARSISGMLAEAWPAVTERLKERWPAFVEAAMQQARLHGVSEVSDLAHYTGLWCLWGASFEDKPGFEWAREILDDDRRSPPLKLHQLMHRTRAELERRQPAQAGAAAGVGLAHFDSTVRFVEANAVRACARVVFPSKALPPRIKACDLSGIDLKLVDTEVEEYRELAGSWVRQPVPRTAADPQHFAQAPEGPQILAVLSHPLRHGTPGRLNLRLQTLAVCDPRVHPEVVHAAPAGRLAWKGRDAAQLSIPLYAAAPENDEPPGIGALPPADLQSVAIASCGMRDAGAPFGDVNLALQVLPATQWLAEVRHGEWAAMQWPVVPGDAPPAAPVVRLQADGKKRDALAWQRQWAGLRTAVSQGLEKLFNAWSRSLATPSPSPRLEAKLQCLSGQAAATWGLRKTSPTVAVLRTEGLVDMVALDADLQLSGELTVGTARARIRLSAKGRSELKMKLLQIGEQADETQALVSAVRSFRFPFAVELDALASPALSTLFVAPNVPQVLGALAGECGLRPRPDGRGMQWFFALRVEAANVVLGTSDPILGGGQILRPLLPALPLVDWSAG